MQLKTVYILEIKQKGIVSRRDFTSIRELRKCLHALDYNTYDNKTYDVPSFKIGASIRCTINGYNIKSETKWGPEYYIGRRAALDNRALVVQTYDDIVLTKPYKATDMVFNLKTMRQVFPPCNSTSSEFNNFLKTIKSQKYNIQKTK